MTVDAAAALLPLLRRARNALWRWRARQTLWYGVCLGALLLLWAGLWHILRGPVAFPLALSLTLAGPVLTAVYALLWQRPDYAGAAAALDRAGDHQDFFVSAWEAHRTPVQERSAGAVAVLQEAASGSCGVLIPAAWSTSPRWYSRFSVLPWAVLLSGLFLLQLPAAQVGPAQVMVAPAASSSPADDYRREQPLLASAPVPGRSGVASGQAVPRDLVAPQLQAGQQPPEDAVVLGEELTAALLPEQGAGTQETAGQSTDPAGAPADAAAADQGDGPGQGAGRHGPGIATPPETDPRFQGTVAFVDIARAVAGDAATPAAGPGAVELSATGAAAGARAARSSSVVALPSPVRHSARFSPGQRRQIANYFKQIQELP